MICGNCKKQMTRRLVVGTYQDQQTAHTNKDADQHLKWKSVKMIECAPQQIFYYCQHCGNARVEPVISETVNIS